MTSTIIYRVKVRLQGDLDLTMPRSERDDLELDSLPEPDELVA